MKLVGNLQGVIPFNEIQAGDLFVYMDRLYMKVTKPAGVGLRGDAVNVETGELCVFEPSTSVRPRKGELKLL